MPLESPRLLDLCLTHIQKFGWSSLNLFDVAMQAKIPLAQMYAVFPDKESVFAAFIARIDHEAALLAGSDCTPDDRGRDRLFAATMARFEAAAPYKEVVQALRSACLQDPQLILQSFSSGMRSVTRLLDTAGLETRGWGNFVRLQTFAVIYCKMIQVWLSDETTDMTYTMGALDRHLDWLSQIPGFF